MAPIRNSSDTRRMPFQKVNGNDSIGKTGNKQSPSVDILLLSPTSSFVIPPPPPPQDPKIPPPPSQSQKVNENNSIGKTCYEQSRSVDIVLPSSTRGFDIPPPPPLRNIEVPLPPPHVQKILESMFKLRADEMYLIAKNFGDYKQRSSGVPPPPPPQVSANPPSSVGSRNPLRHPHSILPSLPVPVQTVSGEKKRSNDDSKHLSSLQEVPPLVTPAFSFLFLPSTAGEKSPNLDKSAQLGYFATLRPEMIPPGYPSIVYVLPPYPGSEDPLTAAMQKLAAKNANSFESGRKQDQNVFGNNTRDISRKPRYSDYRSPIGKPRSNDSGQKYKCSSRKNYSNNRNRDMRRDEGSRRYRPYNRQPFNYHRHQWRTNEHFIQKYNTPSFLETSKYGNVVVENSSEQKEETNQDRCNSRNNYIYSIEIEKIFTKELKNVYREERLNLTHIENETEEFDRMTVVKFFVYHLLKRKMSWFGDQEGESGKEDFVYFDGSRTIRVRGANFKGKRGSHIVSLPRAVFSETQLEELKTVLKQNFQCVDIEFSVTKTKATPEEQELRLEKLINNENSRKISISKYLKKKKHTRSSATATNQ